MEVLRMRNKRSRLKAFLFLPKMRIDVLLLASIIFLGLQAGAYAQATFQVGSIPVTTATNTDNAALAGDVVLTLFPGGFPTMAGTITIAYPVPITIPFSSVTVTGTGGFVGLVSVNAGLSSNAGGILSINVPAGVSADASIRVSGVRLAVAGSSLVPVTATVTSVSNVIASGQGTVVVISSMASGIASLNGIAGEIYAVTGAVTASPWVGAREGYINAFDTSYIGDTSRVLVRFKLDSPPPAGVTVTFPAKAVAASSASSSIWETTDSEGNSLNSEVNITSSSPDLSVYYKTNTTSADPSFFNRETLSVPVQLTVSGSGFSPGSVTYTASLGPVGDAFGSGGSVISSPIPRFADSALRPATRYRVCQHTVTGIRSAGRRGEHPGPNIVHPCVPDGRRHAPTGHVR